MRIQKTGNQSYNKKTNFGAIRVIGDDSIGKLIMNTVSPLGDKNFKSAYSYPFLYTPFKGMRQYFVSGAAKTEEKIVMALRAKGHKPVHVPNSGPIMTPKAEFDKFVQDYNISDF